MTESVLLVAHRRHVTFLLLKRPATAAPPRRLDTSRYSAPHARLRARPCPPTPCPPRRTRRASTADPPPVVTFHPRAETRVGTRGTTAERWHLGRFYDTGGCHAVHRRANATANVWVHGGTTRCAAPELRRRRRHRKMRRRLQRAARVEDALRAHDHLALVRQERRADVRHEDAAQNDGCSHRTLSKRIQAGVSVDGLVEHCSVYRRLVENLIPLETAPACCCT